MKFKAVALLVGVALLIGIGAVQYRGLRDDAGVIAVKRLEHEHAYLTALRENLARSAEPDLGAMASAFVSASTINTVLEGLDGIHIPLEKPSGMTLEVQSIRTQFLDGFPEVRAKAQVIHNDSAIKVGVQLTLVLEPRVEAAHPNVLQLYAKPTALIVDSSIPAIGALTSSQVSDVLRDLSVRYAETLPHASVPMTEVLNISQPPSHLPIALPTGNGRLIGVLDTPALSAAIPIKITGLVFLSDGIHVFLGVGDGSLDLTLFRAPVKDVSALQSEAALQETAARRKAEIEHLRAEIQPKAAALKVADADFRLWIAKDALVQLNSAFNGLTDQQRTVQYRTTSEEGQIYNQGGGGAGCGGFANVVGGNSASAQLRIGQFTTGWTEQGVTASADLNFAFQAQIHAHVRGAAGPHTFMGQQCVHVWPFKNPVCTDVPQVTISCATPIGGGVGLGSFGLSGTRTERITVKTTLRSDPTSWLIYDVAVASPDAIPITINIGLGQLGTVGIPISFPVPRTTLMSGKAPPLFAQSGELALASIGLRKLYDVTLVPAAGVVGPAGFASKGKLKITWRDPLASASK